VLSRLATLSVTAALTLGAAAALSTPASATSPATASAAAREHVACTPTAGASARQELCQSMAATPQRTPSVAPGAAPPPADGHSPTDLRSAYAVPGSSTTATVAIVDAYGDPSIASYLATYRTAFGESACTVANKCLRIVNQSGQTAPLPGTGPAGWRKETALDVDMVSAICPSCHILLVQATDDDTSGRANLETAVKRAVTMGAKFVSMSWGRPESSSDTYYNSTFATTGVAYVASAGDDGYGTLWPAASPYVTAVGGTKLSPASNARGWSETVWNELAINAGATGSGCSTYEGKPVWQTTAIVPASVCGNRAETDVSMEADPQTGVAIYSVDGWQKYGGTSAAAPMIAALYAIAGTPRADSYPAYYPYANASGHFNDVVSGTNYPGCTNTLCAAKSGWDGPTGLGTPITAAGFKVPSASVIKIHNPGHVYTYAGHYASASILASDSRQLPVTYSVTGMPNGMSVHANGTITGYPKYRGAYTVRVTSRDVNGGVGTTYFYWTTRYHYLVPSVPPRLVGNFRTGHVVRASYGTFRVDRKTGAHASPRVSVQWYSNGHAIRGATHRGLRISSRYRHTRLSVRVRASRAYYYTYAKTLPSRWVH
jgi:subtilase family serine protease